MKENENVNYFNRKERAQIDAAYVQLRIICETDSKAERWLDEAYKYERKERSSMSATQALLIECFCDGWKDEGDVLGSASRVFGLSDGCGKAYVLGALARHYYERAAQTGQQQYRMIVRDGVMAQLHAAELVAHRAQDRYLDELATQRSA